MATSTAAAAATPEYRYKLPFVISASAAGTVIEWYDFYLYGVLAAFFSTQFFPPGDNVAALLVSLATFGAGFAVRPFGAAFFGRIGDIVGRKFTFLVTITVMGVSTALVGFLPTYAQIGILAPIILVTLRLAQGLALGGEYGGAAIYVAEHSSDAKRGQNTSWIQTTATLGLLLALLVIGDHPIVDVARGFHGLRLADPVPPVDRPRRARPVSSACDCRKRRSSSQLKADGKSRRRPGATPSATGRTGSSSSSRSSARPLARPSSGTRASSRRCSSSARTLA